MQSYLRLGFPKINPQAVFHSSFLGTQLPLKPKLAEFCVTGFPNKKSSFTSKLFQCVVHAMYGCCMWNYCYSGARDFELHVGIQNCERGPSLWGKWETNTGFLALSSFWLNSCLSFINLIFDLLPLIHYHFSMAITIQQFSRAERSLISRLDLCK